MSRPLALSLLLSLSTLVIGLLSSCSSEPQFDSSMEELVYEMQSKARFSHSPFSGAILVSKGDSILYKNAIGITEGKHPTDITLDSRFCIGSLSKQFTAALVLKLAEDGLLQLDTPIVTYLPELFEDPKQEITLHQLLSHTSGLPHYYDIGIDVDDFYKKRMSPEEYLQFIAKVELRHPPGEYYYFSSWGYALVGVILERVSGRSYSELLSQYITRPLALKNTGYAPPMPDSLVEDFEYKKRNNPMMQLLNSSRGYHSNKLLQRDLSNAYSASGMYSSLNDIHRWLKALRGGEVLSKESTERLFRPNKMGYCYGWYRNADDLFRRNSNTTFYYCQSSIMGYQSMIALHDDGTNIICLSNVRPLNFTNMLHQFYLKANKITEFKKELNAPSLRNRKRFENEGGFVALRDYYTKLSEKAGYPMPPRTWVLRNLIKYSDTEEKFQEVAKYIQETLKIHARPSGSYLNSLGYSYLNNKRIDEAIALFQKNLEFYPNSANFNDSLGEGFAAKGEKEEARKYFEKAIQIAKDKKADSGTIATYEEHLEDLDKEEKGGGE